MLFRSTSIVVTHDMRLAHKVADRVVFLHQARAAYFGPMSEINKDAPPYLHEFMAKDEMPVGEGGG